MDIVDGMKNAIREIVRHRLNRSLTTEEEQKILKPRSLMAFDNIINHLSDQTLTKSEFEELLSQLL